MQKLTILILITLAMTSTISADDDPILLERDIFYWKPAGPDIPIPDIFLHPEIISYPSPVFSDVFTHPELLPDAPVPSAAGEITISGTASALPDWTPPGLSLPDHSGEVSFDVKGFYPYGYGGVFSVQNDPVSFELSANYDPGENYPGWIGTVVEADLPRQEVSGAAAWRKLGEQQFLSRIRWSGSSGGSIWSLDPDLHFSEVLDTPSGEHSLAAGGSVSAIRITPFFHFSLNLGSEYLVNSSIETWNINPGLTAEKIIPLIPGDLSLTAGILTDIRTEDLHFDYYPEFKIMLRKHGEFSVFIETSGSGTDEIELFRFLLEEPGLAPEILFYRGQETRAGLHFTLQGIRGYTAAGMNRGEMPVVSEGIIRIEDGTVFYSEIDLSGQFINRIIMEINSCADYLDRGKLRYLGRYSMVYKGKSAFPFLSFDIHSGNRELVRGYRNFYYTDSDILYGTGLGVALSEHLKVDFSLDYAFPSARIEGGGTLSYSY